MEVKERRCLAGTRKSDRKR